jgi:hypothetical protein
MVTPEQAAEAAMNYLLALPANLLGGRDEPRLEDISKEEPSRWHVILSYVTRENSRTLEPKNPLARSLMEYRLYKEFIVDAENGSVLRMKDPPYDA